MEKVSELILKGKLRLCQLARIGTAIIKNRNHLVYITYVWSHTGLPGLIAKGNEEIDELLIGNELEASEFHKKHHVNSKGLKKDFFHHLAKGQGIYKEKKKKKGNTLLVLAKNSYLQEVTQSIFKWMKSGRWMC